LAESSRTSSSDDAEDIGPFGLVVQTLLERPLGVLAPQVDVDRFLGRLGGDERIDDHTANYTMNDIL
jgi:hypothetical protein